MTAQIYVFPGPCKTGTTSIYTYFKDHPEVKCLGGKEYYGYTSATEVAAIKQEIKTSEKKAFFIFNHNALFSRDDLESLETLGATPIVIVRDPFEQTVSRILHDLRVGVYTLDEIVACDELDEIDERLYARSDYLLWHDLMPIGLKSSVKYVDFNHFRSGRMYEVLCELLDLQFHAPVSGRQQENQGRLSRAPKLLAFLRFNIRPLMYRLGLGRLWTTLKLSRFSQLVYTDSGYERAKELVKQNVDEAKTKRMLDSFIRLHIVK